MLQFQLWMGSWRLGYGKGFDTQSLGRASLQGRWWLRSRERRLSELEIPNCMYSYNGTRDNEAGSDGLTLVESAYQGQAGEHWRGLCEGGRGGGCVNEALEERGTTCIGSILRRTARALPTSFSQLLNNLLILYPMLHNNYTTARCSTAT
jgi:hypothetical protein